MTPGRVIPPHRVDAVVTGQRTLAQDRASAAVPQAPAAAIEAGALDVELSLDALAADLLANCGHTG